MDSSHNLASEPSEAATAIFDHQGQKPGAVSLFLKRHINSTTGAVKNGSSWGLSKAMATKDQLSQQAIAAARTAKDHANPHELNKDYRHLLHLTQEISHDKAIEKMFFVPTRGRTKLADLTVNSANKRFGHDYYPVHRLSFDWAMAQLDERLEDFSFIDYGAGRGRALLLAALNPFRKVIGLEFAQELQDDANMNIAQFPRSLMKCRDVECRHVDAVNFSIPDEKCVLFFNNPFEKQLLDNVLERITASYRANPRRIYLVFVQPVDAEPLDRQIENAVVFEPLCHSQSEKMRLQILSPDQVQIFKTLI